MQKLTNILAVADVNEELPVAIDKAIALSRSFGSTLELLVEVSHDAVIRRIQALGPDLVVKASTARHPLRRWAAGDWKLANECPVPLLLARATLWRRPARFAAAVDVADPVDADHARSILQSAGFLALGMHAGIEILYSEIEADDERVRMERTVRLAQMVREFHVGCESIRRLEGRPDVALSAQVAGRRYDLLVLGASARSEALAGLRPGTASRLAEAADCDVLLVKPPRARETRTEKSARQHRADEMQQLA
jgi:nucleotide-binding universal stress UspA family protein